MGVVDVPYPLGVTKHEDDDHRGLLEAGGHKGLSWGEVDNLVGAADRKGHPEAACSRDRGKDQGTGHVGEGEEGGNMGTYAPMDASCHSPCEVLTLEKGCGSHLFLGISLDCGLSHGRLDHVDGSFHVLFLDLCQI